MTAEQIAEYMRALFEALQHLHTNRVIHRDIKPGNFLYNIQQKSFALVDFGLAQLVLFVLFFLRT
jgi:cell division control protein 7